MLTPGRPSGHWSRSFASCGRMGATHDPNGGYGSILTTCTLQYRHYRQAVAAAGVIRYHPGDP